MTEKKKKQTEAGAYPGEVLSRDASAEDGPPAVSPAPEAVEKFDAIMAEEVKALPVKQRRTAPFSLAEFLIGNKREDLPEGCLIYDEGADKIIFEVPPVEDRDHAVTVEFTGPDKASVLRALDVLIRAARAGETHLHDGAAFFLHAVNYRWMGLNRMSLKYIFRQRPSEALSGEEVRNA